MKRLLLLIEDTGAFKVEYEGNWSRYEVDRMYQLALRELPRHKRQLVAELEKEKEKLDESRSESKSKPKSKRK